MTLYPMILHFCFINEQAFMSGAGPQDVNIQLHGVLSRTAAGDFRDAGILRRVSD